MASSPVELFTGDGVEDEYTYVFEVPGNYSAVLVKTRPTTDELFSQATLDVEYTHNASTKLITFQPGFIPADGTIIRIERFSNRDRQVNYVGGSTIEERNLDNDPNRLTMVTQEIEAGLLDALRRADDREAWNGEGLPSEGCADAVEADGWVTLQQLEQALGAGGLPTSVSEGLVFTFTGNNTQTEYPLDTVSGIHKELLNVFIENVYQTADGSVYDILRSTDTGYPTGGNGSDFIQFAVAPPAGASIEIRTLRGSFFSEVPDFSITTPKLADDAVTLPKINVGVGSPDRFLVIDSGGNPSARLIGGADIQAAVGDENASLASPFSILLRTLRLDQFAQPTSAVPFNSKKITTLGAGTPLTTDGCNVTQMETHVAAQIQALGGVSLQTDKKTYSSDQRTGLANSINQLVSTFIMPIAAGFKPDIVFLFISGIVWNIQDNKSPPTQMLIFMPDSTIDNGVWKFVAGSSLTAGASGLNKNTGLSMKVTASITQYEVGRISFSAPLADVDKPIGNGFSSVHHIALKF